MIYVAGIGSGSPEDITPAVLEAVKKSDVIVGYEHQFQLISDCISEGTQCIDSGMLQECQLAEDAIRFAHEGKTVCVISSGDAGIYGVAPLICEMEPTIELQVLPGVSAFQKVASLLGAPIGHDLCIISLSDLMTPWTIIERKIKAAAYADFVTAVYNPKSNDCYWQLHRLVELFKKERSLDTPVGYVSHIGHSEQEIHLTTLGELNPEDIDMFSVVLIGNSQSFVRNEKFITPRGYFRDTKDEDMAKNVGQGIMIKSFQTIRTELKNPDIPLWKLWPMLHAIHTTADFDMENLVWMDDDATAILYNKVKDGSLKCIVTDVTMVASGIRKGALERLGIEVVCYINDPRGKEMAKNFNITRAQAGMRLAAEEHPDALYVFGNAPTALLELCSLIRQEKCYPAGIIGAPVGFVHVEESKHAAKPFTDIPKILIEGRKGGSNLAATLVNSILTYDDAEGLLPGRDV